ncbi:uncharacterized protein L199_001092 [Kwoniella botswanensis]|uniref:uncharacterized protein n=1 Tax=Kwoniella botswanensis TaxID=1268659 RepID=UPI00315DF7E8
MKGLTANEVTFDPSNRPDNHSLELAREYEQSLQRDMERSLVNVSQVYPKHLDPSNPEHFIELTKEGEKSWAETCKSYIETYGSGSDSRFRNTYKSVFDCKERSQFSDSGRIGWMRYEREVERMKESRSEEQRP